MSGRKPRARRPAPGAGRHSGGGVVRIIAGKWRGRRLTVPEAMGLRPTPDRVRETLFAWLTPHLPGARCLDLFAGTGVLGLECLSRGAEHATLMDTDAGAVRFIRETADMLGATNASIRQANALEWLQAYDGEPFDVVFVDPPYASELQSEVLDLLMHKHCITPDARVYVEEPQSDALVDPGDAWSVLRSKQAGQVRYHLLSPSDPDPDSDG